MKKLIYIILLFFIFTGFSYSQLISVKEARTLGPGHNVRLTGIVTNGSELGSIRFFQDTTAGLAAYSYSLGNLKQGDSILISGTLKNYAGLLELDPVSEFTVLSQNHNLPDPVEITPDEIKESLEGMLIKIHQASFETSSETFEGNKNYAAKANGQSFEVRINSSSNIPGEAIPTGTVSITGILGQYSWDQPDEGYQLLLRSKEDIISESSINMVSRLTASGITTSGFDLHWQTDTDGTTEIFYGKTENLELGKISISEATQNHTIPVTGGSPSEILYIKAFSTNGVDTAFTPTQIFITQSLSSGNIKVYFNRSVDHSVSTGENAIMLDYAIDDTLIAYINRAKYSIDMAIYNLNNDGISNISTALNQAYDRGVKVRVVYDGNTNNNGIRDLYSNIGKIASPESDYPNYGIMHNKFLIFDAHSPNPEDPLVWTGSTNLTRDQINTDANNVIIIQDQSLAIAYQLEFEEMFGSEGLSPDPLKSKFGPDKKDQTAHFFKIGGHETECYFSPSDKTNARILETINNASSSLNISTMLITRTDIGSLIAEKTIGDTDSEIVINSKNQSGMEEVVNILTDALNENFRDSGETGLLHHKYIITDHAGIGQAPVVLTGSHNWSSAAELRNDENTLIIHDDTIANLYYQEFVERFGNGKVIVVPPECIFDSSGTAMGTSLTYNVIQNDRIYGSYQLNIVREPANGSAGLPDEKNITYTPNTGFTGIDTIVYKVCMLNDPALCDSAIFVIFTQLSSSTGNLLSEDLWNLYPNPAESLLCINFQPGLSSNIQADILDLTGQILKKSTFTSAGNEQRFELNLNGLLPGVYILRLKAESWSGYRKFVIQR